MTKKDLKRTKASRLAKLEPRYPPDRCINPACRVEMRARHNINGLHRQRDAHYCLRCTSTTTRAFRRKAARLSAGF